LEREIEKERPITSQEDLGDTIPVLGLTQYFFGFVVFTYNKPISNFHTNQYYKYPEQPKQKNPTSKTTKNVLKNWNLKVNYQV
jgi:hypothetical protein